jgi:hypothetical protein
MKDARETTQKRERPTRRGALLRQRVRGRTAEQRVTGELNVHFIEEPRWKVEAALGPTSASAHRRVLALSEYADLAPPQPPVDVRLARKMAWAILRARAAANCLGLV